MPEMPDRHHGCEAALYKRIGLPARQQLARLHRMNGSKEAVELIRSGKLLASGDFNGFIQGCVGTEIAVRNLRMRLRKKCC